MSLIIYGGDRATVERQIACTHRWHGPCMDGVSRYNKCLKCFVLSRDVDDLTEYHQLVREEASKGNPGGVVLPEETGLENEEEEEEDARILAGRAAERLRVALEPHQAMRDPFVHNAVSMIRTGAPVEETLIRLVATLSTSRTELLQAAVTIASSRPVGPMAIGGGA